MLSEARHISSPWPPGVRPVRPCVSRTNNFCRSRKLQYFLLFSPSFCFFPPRCHNECIFSFCLSSFVIETVELLVMGGEIEARGQSSKTDSSVTCAPLSIMHCRTCFFFFFFTSSKIIGQVRCQLYRASEVEHQHEQKSHDTLLPGWFLKNTQSRSFCLDSSFTA